MSTHQSNEVYLQIVPVLASSSIGKREKIYALFDTRSQRTLIREDFAAELKLHGDKTKIKMSSIKDQGKSIIAHEVDLKISSIINNKMFEAKGAFIIPVEKFNMPSQKYLGLQYVSHLRGLKLADIRAEDIKVLIGADIPEVLHQLDIKSGGKGEPIAIKTPFGWTVFGSKCVCKSKFNQISVNCLSISSEEDLNNTLRSFWKMDSEIIKVSDEGGLSQDDKNCLARLESMTVYKEGKYEVPILWQEDKGSFPNNYNMALKRINMLKQRLKRDPDLRKKCEDTIITYIQKDYAKKLSKGEGCKVSERTWYLPHHTVFNKNKPEKFRIVFDAAAEYNGNSLNKALLTGPDLLNSLVGVLLRFRNYRVAFSADIEAMYHQVQVNPDDADALRFLWLDVNSDEKPDTYQMLLHIFGGKDSPSCANYAVRRTASDHGSKFDEAVAECVNRFFYMDDLLKSVETEKEAISIIKQLIELMQIGGFNLTKFQSNRKEVLDCLSPQNVSQSTITFDKDGANIQRTLGIHWNITDDTFFFSSKIIDSPPTKRGVLSAVSTIFDPIGILASFILKAELLLQ